VARELRIAGTLIDDESDAYVIAEVGANHQGRVDVCKAIFDAASQCGANAVKLQKRDNRVLFTRAMYESPYDNDDSFGATYGAHREALEFGREEFTELQAYARQIGLDFFATPYDFPSVDFLMALDVPAFKIASGDLTNTPLLDYVARSGKPVILSTGGGTMNDVQRAADAIGSHTSRFALLQCTTVYPARPEQLNLRVIETFRNAFPDQVIGFSDHQSGIAMSLVAYVLGARIIEKHFTCNRAWKGSDHKYSLEPIGMQKLVRDLRRARVALGSPVKTIEPDEIHALHKRGKKMVAARALPSGHVISADDVAFKSPNNGLAPYRLGDVIGRVTTRALAEDEDINFDVLSGTSD
jgi:N-acetylneuraminate synthase/sialic acid synthase